MLNIFRKIWKFADKEEDNIKKSIFYGFLNAIFNALQFFAIYFVLTKIFTNTVERKNVVIVFFIMILSACGKVITQNKSQLMQTHAGYFMAANKRMDIGEKIKKVSMGFFSDFNLGRLTNLVTTNLGQIEMWVPMLLVLVLGGLITTFVFVCSLFLFNIKAGVIASVGVLLFLFITSLMEKKSKKDSYQASEIQSELTSEVLSTINGMQVIKSYNLTGENNEKLIKTLKKSCDSMLAMEKTIIPFIVLQRLVVGLTIATMIYVTIRTYLEGVISLPDTIMTMIASFVIFEGLIAAGSQMALLRITEKAIDSLEYINDIPNIKEGKITDPIKKYNISFENVSFSYDKKDILKNVSCNIKENTMTAVIGPSGSGKTTFCNLIARFWDVNNGCIKIGDTDIREYTLSNLMENISMVFQDVYLFNDTIENNIKFGKSNVTREEVIVAAKKAMCHEFIQNMEKGYDTLLGEGGASLSGGEKQRISIARAILKDAPIIIFDEATANIDPENERKLKVAIEELTKDKTIIMIAHQLSTIQDADQILVLNNGKIEQRGIHKKLIEQGGLYKTLIGMKNKATIWKITN